MSGCDLVVAGAEFDVDKYLEQSSFAPIAEVSRRGDSTGIHSRPTLLRSGFRVPIFEFSGCGIKTVIANTVDFLGRYKTDIMRASKWPGVDQCEVAVLMWWFEDTAALPIDIPAEFSQIAGATGVSLAISICATSHDL